MVRTRYQSVQRRRAKRLSKKQQFAPRYYTRYFYAPMGTPEEQRKVRHNRFLARLTRNVRARASAHTCPICLETPSHMFNSNVCDEETGMAMVTCCDHVVHHKCFQTYTKTYVVRCLLSGELSLAKPKRVRDVMSFGAPCPMCRCDLPMRHLSFHS